ncbi:MAG: hypothetical protein SPL37_06560 [Prevotella sp.]|nr:hypothetical protein [Prevotella sp.]
MKKLFTLIFLAFVALSLKAQYYPIIGNIAIGMSTDSVYSNYEHFREANCTDSYFNSHRSVEVKIGGQPFSLEPLTIVGFSWDFYDVYKSRNYNPNCFSQNQYSWNNKLVAMTYLGCGDFLRAYNIYSKYSLNNGNKLGVYLKSPNAHNEVIENISELKDMLSEEYGNPVVSNPITKKYTLAKNQRELKINTPSFDTVDPLTIHGITTDGITYIPFYEWQYGELRVVLGIVGQIGVPYITFYNNTVLNKTNLEKVFEKKVEPKEVTW